MNKETYIDMHATTEQLLEIKDGIANDMAAHVQECQQCQIELSCLQNLQEQIFTSADQPIDAELWSRITARLADQNSADKPSSIDEYELDSLVDAPSSRSTVNSSDVPLELLLANTQPSSNFNSLSTAIYSLAGSILLTGFIGLYIYGQQGGPQQSSQLLQANIQELMLNSRGMERALQKVALQSDLLTVSQQSAAERLYWRLTYVDQMIHENEATSQENNPQRMEALWNERVDALTELNQLYFERQQTLDDSEI